MFRLTGKNRLTALIAGMVLLAPHAAAQSRLPAMPGYDQWAAVAPQIPQAVKSGAITAVWAADSKSFEYTFDSRRVFNLATMKSAPAPVTATPEKPRVSAAPSPVTGSVVLARGRGRDADVLSPDGLMRAISRDRNIWIVPVNGGPEKQITADGSAAGRVRHGVGSYVYLEEFSVSQPVWWSPDGKKLAWMRYDETKVEDYFLQLDQTKTLSTMLVQAYPHPGTPNPVADLMVYDTQTGVTKAMDVRQGAAFSNDVVGYYVWAARWGKDSSEIFVQRTDRLQKHFDLGACAVATGACRSVVRESRPASWTEGEAPRFLDDGKRFIWTSERTDFRNLYLYDLNGTQLAELTRNAFDMVDIVKVDEQAGWLWYTARSGDNHMLVQLHRVKLDGSSDRRLTDPKMTHRVDVSPDGRYFVDVEQTHDKAPVSRLRDFDGKLVAELAASDVSGFDRLGLKRAEQFTFTAADGESQLYGQLQFPSNFDPSRKYPMLVSVYGGPASNGLTESFVNANPLAEYGFLILKLDARTNLGRGRKPLDATYKQLGVAEMDDFAAGIRSLWDRSYVDHERVGMYGTSYGGTVSAAMVLRHPDVVQAASASSPVTDYRLYDTVYSERHLGLPDTDADAYDRASLLPLAGQLKRSLLLYYGTSDDNVHPKNTLQLIKALQGAGKSFEVQVGPDKGHTGVDQGRMMEFFIERLILDRQTVPSRSGSTERGPNADPG
ncbi:MAG TPA: DPP IV N-terminal domain-containing protein [Hyphomonadaceae bacterium]|nr:DPP IV N-terminal domain-containing protein [Hyphomonadaceae bacterium]